MLRVFKGGGIVVAGWLLFGGGLLFPWIDGEENRKIGRNTNET